MGYVTAFNKTSGVKLWRTLLYSVQYNDHKEKDKQDVYLETMVLKGRQLIMEDELGRRWSLDVDSPNTARQI
jgi:hypothetical protein